MKVANKYFINVLATGFVVLVLLSILLFWARKTCQAVFYDNLRIGAQVNIQPSGLLPELDSAPQVVMKSSVDAFIEDGLVFNSLGIMRDFWELDNGKLGEFFIANEYSGPKGRGYFLVLFDKNSGLFVFYDVFKAKRGWSKKAIAYAGPKGLSKTAYKNLGRFSEPHKELWRGDVGCFTFFDRSNSRFFQIRYDEKAVVKGTQLTADYSPVQMGGLRGLDKNGGSLGHLEWSPPLRKQTLQDEKDKKRVKVSNWYKDGTRINLNLVSAAEEKTGTYSQQYSLILEESGEIRKLDSETLELSGPVAFLPSASDSVSRAKPEELSDYAVRPFLVNDEYSGTIAASISREAMEIQVAVFDKDGNSIKRRGSHIDPFSMPGGPALTILNYLLENLQPACLGLVSYFTASTFEAVNGHTGIFILPNSLVAMINRAEKGILDLFFIALIVISPSIILGLLLGFAVYKDATVTGFSKSAKRYWLFGTILFGLSAYIAYRLTKPKETLVTCQNCGKMRRPDMVRCHRCGGKWQIPELTPPTWRVIIEPDKKIAG